MTCIDSAEFVEKIAPFCHEPTATACAHAVLAATTQLGEECLRASIFGPAGPPIGAYACYGEGRYVIAHLCSTSGYSPRTAPVSAPVPAGAPLPVPVTVTKSPTIRPFDAGLRKAGIYTTLAFGTGITAFEVAKYRHQEKAQATARESSVHTVST